MTESKRLENERNFHNKSFKKKKKLIARFYLSTNELKNYFRSIISNDCANKRILEYGCGSRGESLMFADKGAKINAIDISDTAIELGRKEVEGHSSADRITFERMNAEDMTFEKDFFDIIYGMGIIHHLDIETAYGEIARVLKPEGYALFFEPLGYNPLVNLFRKLTPNIRTVDEHPLLERDFKVAEKYFDKVEVGYYILFSPIAGLFPEFFRNPTMKALKKLDRFILRIPFLRKYAWVCIMKLSQPKCN